MTISDAPGVQLARLNAAFRRARGAWDDVLQGFDGAEREDAVSPFSPTEEADAAAPESTGALAERRQKLAEEMRRNWPEGKPRRRWWPWRP